jgi:hypothetical protein
MEILSGKYVVWNTREEFWIVPGLAALTRKNSPETEQGAIARAGGRLRKMMMVRCQGLSIDMGRRRFYPIDT